MSARSSSSRAAFAGGADDEAAGNAGAVGLQHALQAQALFVARNFARNADVIDGRHVDQKPAGQRDMRSDARAFLSERLLGDLNDDFLTLFQQIADGGPGGPVGAQSPAGAPVRWSRCAAPEGRSDIGLRRPVGIGAPDRDCRGRAGVVPARNAVLEARTLFAQGGGQTVGMRAGSGPSSAARGSAWFARFGNRLFAQ